MLADSRQLDRTLLGLVIVPVGLSTIGSPRAFAGSSAPRDLLWLWFEIPGGDNVLRAFCFLYEMQPDLHVMLLGELGFANHLGMDS